MNIYAFAELVITFLLPEYVHLGYCFMGWSQNFIRRWISLDRFNWYDMGQAWGRKVVCRNRKQLHLLTSSGDLYFTIDTWSTILCIRGGKTNTSEMWRVNRPAMLWFGGADCFGRVLLRSPIFSQKEFFYGCPGRRKSPGLKIWLSSSKTSCCVTFGKVGHVFAKKMGRKHKT